MYLIVLETTTRKGSKHITVRYWALTGDLCMFRSRSLPNQLADEAQNGHATQTTLQPSGSGSIHLTITPDPDGASFGVSISASCIGVFQCCIDAMGIRAWCISVACCC